jgi:hypothetical protein
VVLNIGDARKVDARLELGDVSVQITVGGPTSSRRSADSAPA